MSTKPDSAPGRGAGARSVARVRVAVEVDGAVVSVGVGPAVGESADLVDDRDRAGPVEVAPDAFDPFRDADRFRSAVREPGFQRQGPGGAERGAQDRDQALGSPAVARECGPEPFQEHRVAVRIGLEEADVAPARGPLDGAELPGPPRHRHGQFEYGSLTVGGAGLGDERFGGVLMRRSHLDRPSLFECCDQLGQFVEPSCPGLAQERRLGAHQVREFAVQISHPLSVVDGADPVNSIGSSRGQERTR
jgi:hypothetical protein